MELRQIENTVIKGLDEQIEKAKKEKQDQDIIDYWIFIKDKILNDDM